jgi:glycosyltransferase involved in cell wall biosynthesis
VKILVFLNDLGIGGTEKAACRWAWGIKDRGHDVAVVSLADGPRRAELQQYGVHSFIIRPNPGEIAKPIREFQPDVIHTHAPGHEHAGDILGDALKLLPKIPVVQTNVFGHLYNPREDAWTDFRLYISWTSCVQAARRVYLKLDRNFFRRNSVAVYPLDAVEPSQPEAVSVFRRNLGVADDEVLFGRIGRPDLGKWSDLVLDAFRIASRGNHKVKLLLREAPPEIASQLRAAPDARRFIFLPATADASELRLTLSALDVVLHTALNGESFGYGIAEPMNLGKPVITHSVPWQDQAQIELARHGECGFVSSTPAAMAEAIEILAQDSAVRRRMGLRAREHIRALANPEISLTRLEKIFNAAILGRENPMAAEDLQRAGETAAYLDANQFGHSFREQLALRPIYYRVRFHEWRRAIRLGKRVKIG